VLPDPAEFDKSFKEHFIIFEPRDIVSGDFYWLTQVEDQVILILADCTGHGVPGAFMSIIGHDILNQVIKEERHFDPSKILSLLDERLYAILNKKKSGYSTNDGMDISVCCFNTTTRKLEYSGAGRPLVAILDGSLKLIQGNKTSVGGQRTNTKKQFEKETLGYNISSVFYLMSDGFPDQFGGPRGKKYKSKQLYDLLLSVSSLPLNEQKNILQDTFKTWKGSLEQVDDVCVIGIKL
ncbi:MAG: PP2C family protein-serine/threonine phosphatase, partial [Bacteroidia bacterium]